jgi:hypothetical protein
LSVGLKKKEKTTCQKNILNKLKEKESWYAENVWLTSLSIYTIDWRWWYCVYSVLWKLVFSICLPNEKRLIASYSSVYIDIYY